MHQERHAHLPRRMIVITLGCFFTSSLSALRKIMHNKNKVK